MKLRLSEHHRRSERRIYVLRAPIAYGRPGPCRPFRRIQSQHHSPTFLRARLARPRHGRAGQRCWARRLRADAAPPAPVSRLPHAFRRQGQARHLPAHGRRSVADGPVRLQAGDEGVVRQGPARIDPHGPAADDDDLRPGALPDRAVEVQVRPARRVRHVGQRTAALDRQDGRRHVLRPQHAHRGHQSRAGDHLHPDRQPDHRPALPRSVGCRTAWDR